MPTIAYEDDDKQIQQQNTVAAIAEIIQELIKAQKENKNVNLNSLKTKISGKYALKSTPRLVDIIAAIPREYQKILKPKLLAKPIRTASGIAVVAVMCKPHRCPHINMTGNICVYCPGGPDSDFEYSTQSYTGYEPTSMRAIRARYDPYEQVRSRIQQLKQLNHSVDKVEFIIMGGTFMSLPEDYRDYFIRNLHDALSGYRSYKVEDAVKYSERSKTKCIGITIETRPDYCLKRHLSDMLKYGCTRLEIGVQSVYEDVARDTNRGHTVRAVTECFSISKDAGYKVVAHMMPDLPNVGYERDVAQFKEFFENPAFRADGLKIYPTLVIRGTGLYELWKTGRYKSYPPSVLVDLIARILSLVPPWTRVYRVQRDIPMPLVTSGVEHGNLRELALARMKDLGLKCRDVRTREVGIQELHNKVKPYDVELIRRDYEANGGWETFLSYEDPNQDILIGLLRLRKCAGDTFRPELKGASVVRELHVYGSAVPVSFRDPKKFQHHGFGTLLMEEAERITVREHGNTKLAVISGVGTRDYYRKLGYELEGPYMVKILDPKNFACNLPERPAYGVIVNEKTTFFTVHAEKDEVLPSCLQGAMRRTRLKKRPLPSHRTRSTQTVKRTVQELRAIARAKNEATSGMANGQVVAAETESVVIEEEGNSKGVQTDFKDEESDFEDEMIAYFRDMTQNSRFSFQFDDDWRTSTAP